MELLILFLVNVLPMEVTEQKENRSVKCVPSRAHKNGQLE